jgi:hypothetical protein
MLTVWVTTPNAYESRDERRGSMRALAPHWRLERVQRKIVVRYCSVRPGEGYCGWRRRFIDIRGNDQ